jgi:hypothetical protein
LILTDCIPVVSLPPAPLKARSTKVDIDTGRGEKSKAEQAASTSTSASMSTSASCFEYPFQWQFPAHLPSSLFCFESAADTSESLAEIRYTLSATIVDASRPSSTSSTSTTIGADGVLLQQQYPTAETILYVAAKGPNNDTMQPPRMST